MTAPSTQIDQGVIETIGRERELLFAIQRTALYLAGLRAELAGLRSAAERRQPADESADPARSPDPFEEGGVEPMDRAIADALHAGAGDFVERSLERDDRDSQLAGDVDHVDQRPPHERRQAAAATSSKCMDCDAPATHEIAEEGVAVPRRVCRNHVLDNVGRRPTAVYEI